MFTTTGVGAPGAAAAALVLGVTTPASAETGYVIAFSNEATPLRVWEDPAGCHTFPVGGHVLFNDTDPAITMYSDPLCLFPAEPVARVEAGKGTHISPNGSFKG